MFVVANIFVFYRNLDAFLNFFGRFVVKESNGVCKKKEFSQRSVTIFQNELVVTVKAYGAKMMLEILSL